MAKEKSNRDYIGRKINVRNPNALLPGGEQEEQSAEEKAIIGALHSIIDDIKLDEKFDNVVKAIGGLNVNDPTLNVLNSINDKLIAVVGAMYGMPGFNDSTKASSLLSTLNRVDVNVTPLRGINDSIVEMLSVLKDMLAVRPSEQLEQTALAISQQINDLYRTIENALNLSSEAVPIEESGKANRDATLNALMSLKESVIANPTADNIVRIYEELAKISSHMISNASYDYTKQLNNIVSNLINTNKNIETLSLQFKEKDPVKFNDHGVEMLNEMKSMNASVKKLLDVIPTNHFNAVNQMMQLNEKMSSLNSYVSNIKSFDDANIVEAISKIKFTNSEIVNTTNNKETFRTDTVNNMSPVLVDIVSESYKKEIVSIVDRLDTINNTLTTLNKVETIIDYTSILDSIREQINGIKLDQHIDFDTTAINANLDRLVNAVNNIQLDAQTVSIESKDYTSILDSIREQINGIKLDQHIDFDTTAINANLDRLVNAVNSDSIVASLNELKNALDKIDVKAELNSILSSVNDLHKIKYEYPSLNIDNSAIEKLGETVDSIYNIIIAQSERNDELTAINALRNSVDSLKLETSFKSDFTPIISKLDEINSAIVALDLPKEIDYRESLNSIYNSINAIAERKVETTPSASIDYKSLLQDIANDASFEIISFLSDAFVKTNKLQERINSAVLQGMQDSFKNNKAIIGVLDKINNSNDAIRENLPNFLEYVVNELKNQQNVQPSSNVEYNVDIAPAIDRLNSLIDNSSLIYDEESNFIKAFNDYVNIHSKENSQLLYGLSTINQTVSNIKDNLYSYIESQTKAITDAIANIALGESTVTNTIVTEDSDASEGTAHTLHIVGTGINKDSMQALLDLIAYAETGNIGHVVDEFNRFRELNDLFVNNVSLNHIIEFINALGNYEIRDKMKSITELGIDELVNQIKEFEKLNSLKPITYDFSKVYDIIRTITEIRNSASSKNKNSISNIITSNNDLIQLIESIVNIAKYAEDNKDSVEAVSKFISSIVDIGTVDVKGTDTISNNIRKLIGLMGTPSVLTSLGLSNSGLIYMLAQSVQQLESALPNDLKGIPDFFKTLSDIIIYLPTYDMDDVEKSVYSLTFIFNDLHTICNELNKLNVPTEDKLNEMLKMFNSLSNLSEYISTRKAVELAMDTMSMSVALGTIYMMMTTFDSIGDRADEFKESIKKVNAALVAVSDLNEANKSIINLKDLIAGFSLVNMELILIGVTSPLAAAGIGAFILELKAFKNLIEGFNDLPELKDSSEKLKSLGIVIAASAGVLVLGVAIGAYALSNIGALMAFGIIFPVFVLSVVGAVNIGSKGLNENIEKLESVGKFIALCGGIMLLGGYFMTEYPQLIAGSFLFAAALGSFLLAVSGAINLGTRGMEDNFKTINQFGELVAYASAIMLIGGLFMSIPDMWWRPLAFTALLTTFIAGTLFAYNFVNKFGEGAIDSAEKFGILIGISAASLMLGGLLLYTEPWLLATIPLFGVYLAAFVWGTTLLFNMAGCMMQQAADGARDFSILIGVASLCLLAGGYALYDNPWLIGTIPLFGVLLTAFVIGNLYLFNMIGGMTGEAIKNATQFGILLGVATASLLIGGLFMKIDGMPLATMQFGLLLAGFVGSILLTYALASRLMKRATVSATEFGIITAISAATLLIGGMFMKDPALAIGAVLFAGTMIVYTGMMTLFLSILSKIPAKSLLLGTIALGGIALISLGVAEMMKQFVEVTKQIDNYWDIVTTIGIAIGAVSAFGALAGVIGMIATSGVGGIALVAGEALLAGLVGIIYATGKAIGAVAESAMLLNQMKDLDVKRIGGIIEDYVTIGGKLTKLANPKMVAVANLAAITSNAISKTIGHIGGAVEDFANLKAPLYDEKTGKLIGHRKLEDKDFEAAANNVEAIITTLGQAILDTYNKNPEMFSTGNSFTDFIGMDTPFAKTVKSCTTMGKMISEIAVGVKEYAELKVPVYEGNKIVKYRQLDNADFTKAGENISKIIGTVGGAIMTLYMGPVYNAKGDKIADSGKEMFGWQLFGDNPFAMTVKSCATMGDMISDIAAGIKDYAELKMPIYDKNGNVTGYRAMDETDFTNAASNIEKIITVIGSALITTYESHPEMFTDSSKWHTDADKTPFGMVAKAMTGVGALVLDSAKAVKEVSTIEIPEGVEEKVARIIATIASGIMKTYESNPDWFEDDSWFTTSATKTPFGMVRAAMDGVTNIVLEASKAIKSVNDLDISAAELDPNLVDGIHSKVCRLVAIIPDAIMKVATNEAYEDYFTDEDDAEIFDIIQDSYKKMRSTIEYVSKAYKNVEEMLRGFGEDITVDSISEIIAEIVTALPAEILKEYETNTSLYNDLTFVENIESAFDDYEDTIDSIIDVYTNVYKKVSSLPAINDRNAVDVVSDDIGRMVVGVVSAMNKFNEVNDVTTLAIGFEAAIDNYKDAINDLTETFNIVDVDKAKYDNLVAGIGNMNARIAEVPNLENFREEARLVKDYITTLNSLDVYKIDKFTELANSLSTLATKMGSLDRFTEELANKLAQVLTALTSEIGKSAGVIDNADKIQKSRAEELKKTIEDIKSIINVPLQVNIVHGDEESTTIATSADSSSGSNPFFSGSGVAESKNKSNGNSGINYALLQQTIQKAINASGLGRGTNPNRGTGGNAD